jgi:uncharacterized protein DUF3303
MSGTVYMVVEHFRNGDAVPVYRRFRDHGRLAPEGLSYVNSWVDTKLERCYQLMETENPRLLDEWIAHWQDLVEFEIHPSSLRQRRRKECLRVCRWTRHPRILRICST